MSTLWMIKHGPMLQGSVHNSWKLKTSQFLLGQHTHRTCHPLSMFRMLWIGVYDSVFQFLTISSNYADIPLLSRKARHAVPLGNPPLRTDNPPKKKKKNPWHSYWAIRSPIACILLIACVCIYRLNSYLYYILYFASKMFVCSDKKPNLRSRQPVVRTPTSKLITSPWQQSHC